MRAVTLFLIAAAALALAPAAAPAAVLTCGQTITEDTVLENDLIDCPGDGIQIGASDVTLDLNGHIVDGDRSVGGVGVHWWNRSAGDSSGRITLKNGTVRQFGVGVSITGDDNTVRAVTVTDNATGVVVTLGSRNALVDSAVERNREHGIHLTELARFNRIARNTISANQTGVYSSLPLIPPRPIGNAIVQNRITGNRADGVFLDYAVEDTLVEGNVVSGNADDGIELGNFADDQLIGSNSALGNGDLGIAASSSTGPASDLGGNQAQGNGNPAQCVDVKCDRSGRLLFGDPVHGPSFSQMTGEAKRASPYVLAYGGTVNRVAAFIDGGGAASGTQKIRALLYGRAPGGGPGELLARSFEATIRAGAPGRWVPFWFVFPPKLPPGLYWIGLQTGQTGGVARFAWTSSPTSRWFNIDNFDDAATSPFGPAAVDDQRMSIYASGSY